MRRQDKTRVIEEANQRLEKNYLKSKSLLKEVYKGKDLVGALKEIHKKLIDEKKRRTLYF